MFYLCEMEITDELLETIENRAIEYFNALRNEEPDSISIEGGQIVAEYSTYCYGDTDYEHFYANAEQLTSDLDTVREERLKAKKLADEEAKKIRAKREIERKEREKRNREIEYLKLKKEFEN